MQVKKPHWNANVEQLFCCLLGFIGQSEWRRQGHCWCGGRWASVSENISNQNNHTQWQWSFVSYCWCCFMVVVDSWSWNSWLISWKKWKQDFLIEQEVVIGTLDFCGGEGQGSSMCIAGQRRRQIWGWPKWKWRLSHLTEEKTGVNQELSICCLSCSASNVGWFHGGTTLTCKALKAKSFCSSQLKERGAMNDIQLLSAEAIPLQEQLLVPLLPKAHPGDHTPLK